MISVLSPMRTCVLWSTVIVLPSAAVIAPRTRVCAFAAVPKAASAIAASRASRIFMAVSVRGLDAALADVQPLDDDLAVGFLARVGPDPFAGLEVGARPGVEGDDRRARRHQHLLRTALVVERDLVAAAYLRDAVQVGVRHGRVGCEVPRKVAGLGLRRDGVHLERGHLAVLLDRGDAHVLAFQLVEGGFLGGRDADVGNEVELEILPFARLDRQHVAVERSDGAAHAGRGLRERQRGDENESEESKPVHGSSLYGVVNTPILRRIPMLNPFQAIKKVPARRWTSLPASFRKKRRTAWSDPNRQLAPVDSFLEGPSFDRKGNLWCVDIPFGRIFRIGPKGDWDLVTQYDGWPNGLKIHRDGSIYIADYRKGLLRLDPKSGRTEAVLETAFSEGFKGLNDLHFADNGDLYFTDQGQSGIADPSGRVYRLRVNGELQRLVQNAPSPNGITLNKSNTQVYVAVTRAQQIWRLPLMARSEARRV